MPAVAEFASAVDISWTVDGAAAASSAVVQLIGAARRVLDFGEGRDEVRKKEYLLAELGGQGDEAEGSCMGVGAYLTVTMLEYWLWV